MSTRSSHLRYGAMFTAPPMFFLAISVLAGEYEKSDAVPNDLPDHRAVLRISDAVINSLLGDKDVDRQVAVHDVILGTSIYGAARIVGKPGVQLSESPDQATFKIVFIGTAYSRTTGYNGPAIIHSRSITTFTATRQIIFEPGRGFQGLPPR